MDQNMSEDKKKKKKFLKPLSKGFRHQNEFLISTTETHGTLRKRLILSLSFISEMTNGICS